MGTEVDDFLAATMPRYEQAEIALHNGDAAPRTANWSHNDPVTVFGAARSATGWDEIQRLFVGLGSTFSNCTSFENEVVAAGVSGDLAYIVAFEHTTASLNGRAAAAVRAARHHGVPPRGRRVEGSAPTRRPGLR